MSSNENLREKLRSKIKQKKLGRMNVSHRKQEVDEIAKKMGISEKDMKELVALCETMKKKK